LYIQRKAQSAGDLKHRQKTTMFASSFAFSEKANEAFFCPPRGSRGALFGPRRTGKGGLPPSSMTTTTKQTKQKTFAKKTHLLNERERKRSKRRTLRVVKASDEKSKTKTTSPLLLR
jgi:hypothetical protein